MERTAGGFPKSTQLIMDSYNVEQLQMLKEQTRLGSEYEKERMSKHQRRRDKLPGQEPVVNLMNKLSGVKKPNTDRLDEKLPSLTEEEKSMVPIDREETKPPVSGSID